MGVNPESQLGLLRGSQGRGTEGGALLRDPGYFRRGFLHLLKSLWTPQRRASPCSVPPSASEDCQVRVLTF